jgi:hypothetical protein
LVKHSGPNADNCHRTHWIRSPEGLLVHSAFIARHPTFNRRLEVVGCELLFRGHGWAEDDHTESRERATATVVLNALTELDLARAHRRPQEGVGRRLA